MNAENEAPSDIVIADKVGIIKPLIWEHLGGDHYRAMCPLFGNLRIERYGKDFNVSWSVPGYSASFIEEEFRELSAAVEGTQREYERRLSKVLDLSV